MKLTFKVNKPIDYVFDILTDMKKFSHIHPIIQKIDDLGDNNYLVYETVKLGFIPYSFTYPASVEADSENYTVTIKAVVQKMTKIEMFFQLNQDGNYTIIDETVTFKTFLPIKTILKKLFEKQHQQLFRNIDN